MYEIYRNSKDKSKLHVDMNRKSHISAPIHIALGIGDKYTRYRNWLEESFKRNDDSLRMLVYVHSEATKEGSVCFIQNGTKYIYMYVALKSFLINNNEMLGNLASYLFPDVSKLTEKHGDMSLETTGEALAETSDMQPMIPMSQSSHQLSASDMSQIQALIKQDQEANPRLEV